MKVSVDSGKYGGRYDAAKDVYNYSERLGGDGFSLRNFNTAVRFMENFVAKFAGSIKRVNVQTLFPVNPVVFFDRITGLTTNY
ncbi:MAG: hypothetical protein KAR11_04410 [Phycisphaerae bacterium]|nr:hypothetical protein [Phycisphaerae bacterium]